MIGEKLDALLKVKGMKPGTLATLTGIPKSTIYGIIKRNNEKVKLSTIETIAEVLEVPIEYFSDRGAKEEESKNQPDPEADELEEMVQMFERLTPEQKNFILSSMKGILSGQ
jgi:transcriptional regulator with XRE-family HTH domain